MKLAKKMLAGVIALAMVAALAVTVFAAAPALSLSAGDAVVGQNVTVTVTASGFKSTESADLEINYDAGSLEYVNAEAKTADGSPLSGALPAFGSPSAGSATLSFAFTEAATVDAGTVWTVTFKALKTGTSDVTLKVGSWTGTDVPAGSTIQITVKEEASTEAPTQKPVVDTEPTSEPTTAAGSKKPGKPAAPAKPGNSGGIPQTGEASIAVLAGVMAVAAAAFVATRKKEDK